MIRYIECIDASTEFCPCSLAEAGECLTCCQVNGSDHCDCINWQGTCIYQEYVFNNNKKKATREYKKFSIINKEYPREDILIMKISVNRNLSMELNKIGAYVFIKKPNEADCFSTPVSILDSDPKSGIITVALKIIGVKTKSIQKCDEEIMIKGPYWNGIQGQKFLRDKKAGRILILARGIAAAPAVLAGKNLSGRGVDIHVLLDRGRGEHNVLKNYFENIECSLEDIRFINPAGDIDEEGKGLIKKYIDSYNIKTVLSAGSDNFHTKILNYIHNVDRSINFATVNNSIMCCGEGVCGSCQIEDVRGKAIRACKQQYNPAEIFIKEM